MFGREAAVRVEPDGSVSGFSSNLADIPCTLSAIPSLTADAAASAAMLAVGFPARAERAELGFWPVQDGARLAWQILLRGPSPHVAAYVVVDAETGAAIAIGSPIRSALGRVFLVNPIQDSWTTTEVEMMRLLGDGTTLTGENTAAWQYSTDGTHTQTALPDVSGNFFYDPATAASEPVFDDPFAQVNAYYQVDFISERYQTELGYVQDRGPIPVYVNYVENPGEPYVNAFYDPEAWTISLGQADTGDFAYDADTIYHEFMHSVTDSVAHLLYMGADIYGMFVFPGGLSEGLSDVMAVAITGDPDMGEYIIGRNLVNDRTCPDDIAGESHYDGEIIGGACWEIHELVGGPDLERLAYGAVTMLTPTASYAQFAAGMMTTAEAMETDGDLTADEVDGIAAILADRGIDTCERVMSLDGGETYTVAAMGMISMGSCDMMDFALAAGYSFPPSFQWSIEVPPGATSLTIDAQVTALGPGDRYVWVNLRAGNYVQYEMVEIFPGYTLPVKLDVADATFADPAGPITLTALTDPALETDQTYYITVNYLGCPSASVSISADVGFDPIAVEEEPEPEPEAVEEEPEPEPEPDADDASTEPDAGGITTRGGGCGCAMAS